jgi:hypothetical protein
VRIDHENVQRARLRIDTRKWMVGKLAPKKYGDRPMVVAELPMHEAPRNGDNAVDITESVELIEQDPMYSAYQAWGRARALEKKKDEEATK